VARLSSSDPSTLEQQRLMKRLMVWGGILIALMIVWYLIFHGPFRKIISSIPEPEEYTYSYATPEVVAAGIARPPAGYEWARVGEWTGNGRRALGQVLLNHQWAIIWRSGDLDERGADPAYRQQNPDSDSPRFAVYSGNREIGLTTMPNETGKVRGDTLGNHNISIVTGNSGWRVRVYEMRPIN